MKTIFEHIERVRSKPHHIRKRIALSTAAVCTAVIAFVWLTSSLGTGAFALKAASFAQSAGESNTPTVSDNKKEQLAGIGAATILESSNAPARIEIINASSSALKQKQTEQTIIPF